jgi:tetratricopeptide (TPR) repeat protein/HAMP domain-containing protein
MILLISSVLLLSVIPLSIITLNRSQEIVLKMTLEICSNLSLNIANVAGEELLMNETYDTTKTAISKLKESSITGLSESYVINIDGHYVADLKEKRIGSPVPIEQISYFSSLASLEMTEYIRNEDSLTLLRFAYPIFIQQRDLSMRVGTAVFEFNKEEVYASVVKIRKTIIGVASIIFFAGILIAAYSSMILSKPILILTNGAKRIGEGDLNYRIELHGKDELGQLANTFNHMTSQIQDFTHNLELKVKNRTEELNNTLTEVNNLKIAQDGDYYLTSLLLSPLQPNNNICSNIKTEFFLEQKKKFTFRKWKSQIGGDICITDTIILNGKEYTAFINGDAMGKSIQGAGGALVLGVVFNAGLMRSKVKKYQNIYPENWIKERFLDLYNVFLSFEGSMYISICMGIVDNETGILYYINAEHPWTVLYRDGKASFLEEELALRKLGTPGQEDIFYVRMFPLKSGDVVITGSDGRDDLMIQSETGEEYVQEDENEFLKRVEEGNGELMTIKDLLMTKGKIIDDLSLLKITYAKEKSNNEIVYYPHELHTKIEQSKVLMDAGKIEEAYQNVENLLHENNNFPDLLKLLGKLYFSMKDYTRAIECFEQYLNINPWDNEYLYSLSNAYRVYGNLNTAADIGERLYLRNQSHIPNLLNLGTIYLELRIFGRATSMMDKILQIDPTNERAIDLKERIFETRNSNDLAKIDFEEDIDKIYREAEKFYKIKNFKKALDHYARMSNSERFSNSPRILLKIANCHFNLKNFDKAIIFYNRTLKEDTFNFHARNNLAGIYFKQGQIEKAKIEWMKILEIKSDFHPAQINLKQLEKYSQKILGLPKVGIPAQNLQISDTKVSA